ncbi:hypothetical protein EC973_009001 [Apophysomyces ossiformis]|uniref:PCI domain-containing protein n=1 Tax=Apophysomyces ossiformis TaxID=679940 RepID=A0A8H7BRS5_9FUNG|nr:hypothetical protein EC973_009001 [Apophysomyces ossiformis]
MNESNLSLSTSQHLQPYLLLSKSVKGAANSKLILDALAAPGVYVFSELYEAPNVVEASKLPEVAPYYTLLRLFMYGTYGDYVANASQLPSLNDAQLTKLKQLSIVSLSEESRTLHYDVLQKYLEIANVRELEDLVIEAFYQGILVGKLDQRQRHLQVDYAMGRDLRPGQMEETLMGLKQWSANTHALLEALDNKIQSIQETTVASKKEREEYGRKVEQLRKEIRSKKSTDEEQKKGRGDMEDCQYESVEYNMERGGRAKKRPEIITYQFDPPKHINTIRKAILHKTRQRLKTAPSKTWVSDSGLPSPPVESPFMSMHEDCLPSSPPPSSLDIEFTQADVCRKLEALKEEKHQLFQLIKRLVQQQEAKERQQRWSNISDH